MKFNFNSEFSRDKGVLFFICVRNEPMHRYLTNLDKKNSNYIKQAMKVVNFDYKENNNLDLILPIGSKSDRIIILGVNKNSTFSDIDLGKLGSTITTILNNKKIKEASLIFNDKAFNANEVALLLYGMNLNKNEIDCQICTYFKNNVNKVLEFTCLLVILIYEVKKLRNQDICSLESNHYQILIINYSPKNSD